MRASSEQAKAFFAQNSNIPRSWSRDESRKAGLPDSECNCIGPFVETSVVQLHRAVVHVYAVDQLGVLLVFISDIILEDRQVLQDVMLYSRHICSANPVLGGAPYKALQGSANSQQQLIRHLTNTLCHKKLGLQTMVYLSWKYSCTVLLNEAEIPPPKLQSVSVLLTESLEEGRSTNKKAFFRSFESC